MFTFVQCKVLICLFLQFDPWNSALFNMYKFIPFREKSGFRDYSRDMLLPGVSTHSPNEPCADTQCAGDCQTAMRTGAACLGIPCHTMFAMALC